MSNVSKEGFIRCNFCEDPGLVPSTDIDLHMKQVHKDKLFHCLLCKSLGNQQTGFENFADISKHVVEELHLDSTDRKQICKKILCPGNPEYLKVFRCLLCPYEGMKFVGLSEKTFLDHVAKNHGEDAGKENPLELVWECRVCRGLLVDDNDLTRHVLKRHIRRGIFNSFPFAAFVYSTPEPASRSHQNKGINKEFNSSSVKMKTLLENLKRVTNISDIENEANLKKLENEQFENDNVTGVSESKFDSENEDITEISYSEQDEKRYLRMGSEGSDIWENINDKNIMETENDDNKENEKKEFFNNNNNDEMSNKSAIKLLKDLQSCCKEVPIVKCDLCNKDDILNLSQHLIECHLEASFLCTHCAYPFTEIAPAQKHVKECLGRECKDASGVDLLEKGHIKPPSFLVTVICRMCQPTQRLVAQSPKDLHFKVVAHMEEHRALWNSGEEMVGYGCRICVERSWNDKNEVLDHIERRHESKRHQSKDQSSNSEKKKRHLHEVNQNESFSKYAKTEQESSKYSSASNKSSRAIQEQNKSKEFIKRSLPKENLPFPLKSVSRKYKDRKYLTGSSHVRVSPEHSKPSTSTSRSSKYKGQNKATESDHGNRLDLKHAIPFPNSSSSRKNREGRNGSRCQRDEKLDSQYTIPFPNSNRSRKYKEGNNVKRSRHDKFIPFPNSSSSRKYKDEKNDKRSKDVTKSLKDTRMPHTNHSQNKVKENSSEHEKEESAKVQDYVEEQRQIIENLMIMHKKENISSTRQERMDVV